MIVARRPPYNNDYDDGDDDNDDGEDDDYLGNPTTSLHLAKQPCLLPRNVFAAPEVPEGLGPAMAHLGLFLKG